MKKTLLVLFSMIMVGMTISSVNAKVAATTPETAAAIKLYKAGDYTQAYTKLSKLTSSEPSCLAVKIVVPSFLAVILSCFFVSPIV